MIHIEPTPPNTQQWKDWIKDAKEARERLARTSLGSLKIDEELYKTPRVALLELFHYKCAYCESVIIADQHLGDVEHYRPKGRVTDEDGKLVFIGERPHPGYYWLAYDWLNLLPACIACNRPGKGPSGVASGKWDKFPVAEFRAAKPGEEDQEKPVLLNPWRDDPNEHLSFDDELGVIAAKTERGAANIRILGLNRDGLPELRRTVYDTALLHYSKFIESVQEKRQNEIEKYKGLIAQYQRGRTPYSAFAKAALQKADREFMAELERWRQAALGVPGGLPT